MWVDYNIICFRSVDQYGLECPLKALTL
jgi:hypothetical protein